jgi:hypothetical protein
MVYGSTTRECHKGRGAVRTGNDTLRRFNKVTHITNADANIEVHRMDGPWTGVVGGEAEYRMHCIATIKRALGFKFTLSRSALAETF